jgi:outer membrane protein OmpA-like peptidoglycan-associated protein
MAKENEEKEQALNQYQQIIRNIINTNLISKARIQTRNQLIDTKDSEIATKDQTIVKLEQDISAKETQINQKENQIGKLQADLAKKVSELDQAFKRQQISKKAFEEQKRKLEADTNRRIQALEGEKQGLYQNLAKVAQDLDATRAELAIQAGRAAEIGAQKEALENELGKAREQIQNQREELLGEFAKQRAADRKAFEDALNKERLSGAERAAREDAFRRAAAAKEQELKGKLADLDKQLGATQAELGKALDRLNAQKKLADSLKKNLEARGVQADVDAKTGDVLISFGDTYFDTGRADLKPEMKRVLEQAMPAYAQSLFSDPKVAEKVSSVEIIGFASPTYRGRFVNPNSLEAKDREAVNYNLDLSYARARSIFNYVFDKEKMQFPNQERLLPLVKVTGRSFFPHTKDRIRGVANDESFCQRNDCAQLQKVIIKFNLKD